MFDTVPSLIKRYKEILGLVIAGVILFSIFVPFPNAQKLNASTLCGYDNYGPCPVPSQPVIIKEKIVTKNVIINNIQIINNAIAIAIANGGASAAAASAAAASGTAAASAAA